MTELLVKSFGHGAGLVAFTGDRAESETIVAGLDDPTVEFVDAINFGVSARPDPSQ